MTATPVDSVRTLAKLALGAMVVTGALLGAGNGIAFADKISDDPATPSAGPVAEGGVRVPATQGQIRMSDKGVVQAGTSDVRESNIATPRVKGDAPPPGNLSKLNYKCLFRWSQFC